jgi:hypothetical protein
VTEEDAESGANKEKALLTSTKKKVDLAHLRCELVVETRCVIDAKISELEMNG